LKANNAPGGTMNVMNVDSEGNIWVITNPDSLIYRITPAGEISIFAQNTPIDIPAIDITTKGELIFNAEEGFYRIYPVDGP
jgi:hypothetical protein